MRLVRLEGPGGTAPLDFHPAITVVGGLTDDDRARLCEALQTLPSGGDPGWEGLIEAHGVVLDLGRDALRLLGMQRHVNVVVGPGDLPGGDGPRGSDYSDYDSEAIVDPEARAEELRLSHDILAHGVAALKRTRREFEEARLQAVEAIEEARADLDPFATTAFEQAAGQLRRAEANGHEKHEPEEVESVDDLERERDRLRDELAGVEAIDLEPVVDALHRAERTVAPPTLEPDLAAVRALAEELSAVERRLAEVEARRRDEDRDPADLLRRIEGVRIQLERLEAASVPRPLDPDDATELEAAHDAVVDADGKVSSSRIGGKAARQRLEEALEAEQAVLARVGFPTYTAYSLAKSAPGPDPETRVELQSTRRELAELESAYQSAVQNEVDPEQAELETRCERLRMDGAALVGVDVDELTVDLLVSTGGGEINDERHEAAVELRGRLQEAGVDFGDLGLADDEIVDVARVWVADMAEATAHRELLERDLDTVEARLRVVAPVTAGGATVVTDPMARAQADVEAAEARLAGHRQASDRVAELCGLLEEIESRLENLSENIEAQESLVWAASTGLSDPDDDEPVSAEDLLLPMPEGVDDTEWYLLTRLAAQRSISFAGSVPLVLDRALSDMEREDAHRVLDKVEQMSDVVQVVYLGEDDAVVEWAAQRGSHASVISVG